MLNTCQARFVSKEQSNHSCLTRVLPPNRACTSAPSLSGIRRAVRDHALSLVRSSDTSKAASWGRPLKLIPEKNSLVHHT